MRKKRIVICCLSAVMMCGSIMPFPATAAETSSTNTGIYGTLTGTNHVYPDKTSHTAKTVIVTSTTQSAAYKITVSADVDNRKTGALIYQLSDTQYNSTSASDSHVHAFYADNNVSSFGAHQAQKSNGTAWAVYTSCTNFWV